MIYFDVLTLIVNIFVMAVPKCIYFFGNIEPQCILTENNYIIPMQKRQVDRFNYGKQTNIIVGGGVRQ